MTGREPSGVLRQWNHNDQLAVLIYCVIGKNVGVIIPPNVLARADKVIR